jgi:SPP1 gp7 family putative phage head morphogenesis protein
MISLADAPSQNDLDAWQGKINKVLDRLQSGDVKPEDLDRDLFNFTLNDIKRGFNSSFGISKDINYDTPDFNFLSSIDKNLYRFAGAKSYQELSDFSRMLTGEDGKVVDFKTFRSNVDEYRSKALGIDEQYNKNWLYTEYTNSVNSGLAAKRWNEFQKTADIFPNLEYRTAGDSLVRPEHQQLNGIIKRINDPFWDRYYPPNDWGCRCRARPTADEPTGGKLPDVEIPELFDNNVGKTGVIYNESHPYFTSNGINSSKTFATVRRFEGDDHYAAQLPKYNQMKSKYETVSAINEAGGSIFQEPGFIPEALNLKIARELSKLGDAVVLLRQDKTQATALVQGIKSSFGAAATASDISSAVAAGLPLSGIITIELAPPVKRSAVISSLSGYIKDPRFKSIIFLKSGKRCTLTRKDLTLKNYEPLKSIGL